MDERAMDERLDGFEAAAALQSPSSGHRATDRSMDSPHGIPTTYTAKPAADCVVNPNGVTWRQSGCQRFIDAHDFVCSRSHSSKLAANKRCFKISQTRASCFHPAFLQSLPRWPGTPSEKQPTYIPFQAFPNAWFYFPKPFAIQSAIRPRNAIPPYRFNRSARLAEVTHHDMIHRFGWWPTHTAASTETNGSKSTALLCT
ncbi:hypothetical protein BCR44DRAFT_1311354 [Catenaria anguillulae PL171]|uniref:Uncharacterized protein n=1 Tax=Catenaria anguillulae PL171 TaxID=765915 RepID=A0A1Y2H7C3_9FUNG|nr:hypothetical protein BCR44DRAFT_1311354 [Catenaria anguillulae PL171]